MLSLGGVRTKIALRNGRNKKSAHLHRDAVECRSSERVNYGTMVINCLLPYLHRFRRHVHFRDRYGQTAAIDASCWIHKALSVSFSQSRNRER